MFTEEQVFNMLFEMGVATATFLSSGKFTGMKITYNGKDVRTVAQEIIDINKS